MAIKDYVNADFKLLKCKIIIGDPKFDNPMVIENQKIITEVQSITINDSYKKLINTAEVAFPKGSVFNSEIIKDVTIEGKETSSVVQKNISDDNITVHKKRDGNIVEKTTTQSLINAESVKVGQRISIRIGYNEDIKTMFDGFITSISSENIIVLGCENMAYILKSKQAPKLHIPEQYGTVANICGEKYNLLEGTGFELHPETKKEDIHVGELMITDNFTIADIFDSWNKAKIHTFLKYDNDERFGFPKIAITRPYSSANRADGINPLESAYDIHFDYHVASNNLTFSQTDPMFLAVQATGLTKDNKFFTLTVRKNPSYDMSDPSSKKYQTVNIREYLKKSQKKIKKSDKQNKTRRYVDKVDLSTYTIIPYVSKNRGIDTEQLKSEAITWFETYQENGIEGTVTIFGDYGLSSATLVNLVDDINSDKNGVYIVEEVTTNFGVNGYRQTLKLPYRVKRTEK